MASINVNRDSEKTLCKAPYAWVPKEIISKRAHGPIRGYKDLATLPSITDEVLAAIKKGGGVIFEEEVLTFLNETDDDTMVEELVGFAAIRVERIVSNRPKSGYSSLEEATAPLNDEKLTELLLVQLTYTYNRPKDSKERDERAIKLLNGKHPDRLKDALYLCRNETKTAIVDAPKNGKPFTCLADLDKIEKNKKWLGVLKARILDAANRLAASDTSVTHSEHNDKSPKKDLKIKQSPSGRKSSPVAKSAVLDAVTVKTESEKTRGGGESQENDQELELKGKEKNSPASVPKKSASARIGKPIPSLDASSPVKKSTTRPFPPSDDTDLEWRVAAASESPTSATPKSPTRPFPPSSDKNAKWRVADAKQSPTAEKAPARPFPPSSDKKLKWRVATAGKSPPSSPNSTTSESSGSGTEVTKRP